MTNRKSNNKSINKYNPYIPGEGEEEDDRPRPRPRPRELRPRGVKLARPRRVMVDGVDERDAGDGGGMLEDGRWRWRCGGEKGKARVSRRGREEVRHRETTRTKLVFRPVRSQSSNVGVGSSSYDGSEENNTQSILANGPSNENSSQLEKRPNRIPYPLSIAVVLFGCAILYSLIMFVKGGPSSILAAIAKCGFTAAFTLIFVSEIGDKTFFIAALLAMQYEKWLVLMGSMGALSLMTILSVVIGRIFQSVPAQFQTTLPIGEYAAVTLLLFFGLKAIKDAWDLPSDEVKTEKKGGPELDEYAEAEELVKEKVSTRLSSPLEIIWKSFSLVFFAEWGDRSMLATIALGAAQSPWGVASGAILGHLVATSVAVLGGAFLANYISEKLVGYLGGGLFLLFAVATFFGFF